MIKIKFNKKTYNFLFYSAWAFLLVFIYFMLNYYIFNIGI